MTDQAAWFLARGSGIVAHLLLTTAVVWGLALSTKVLGGGKTTRKLMLSHETISLAAVVATLVHVAALVADTWVHFGWAEVLVPGASAWRPLAVGWGVTALYALVVVTFSFYVRARIGQKAWRWLHFGAFGTWGAATLHGITAGTDSGGLPMVLLYVGSTALVVSLTVLRAVTYGRTRRRPRTSPREKTGPATA